MERLTLTVGMGTRYPRNRIVAPRFPIITTNGPDEEVIEVPIANQADQRTAERYWAIVQDLYDTLEDARDSLDNDNQQLDPEQVGLWRSRVKLKQEALVSFRPIDMADANGEAREFNTDLSEVGERYERWLRNKDLGV